jgi:hypothetical protein
MRQQPTLDQRISAALGSGNVAADDLQALVPEIETGIEEADKIAKAERAGSLDPMASPSDAEQAAQRASVAELRRDRLKAALPRVEQRLAAALAAAYADRWNADANKVDGMADAAAEQLARYAEFAHQIVAALLEAEAANREVERVNGSAPDGVHRRVSKVDLTQFKTLVLPDPDHPGRNLWPEPKPSVAEQYAASMGAPAHPGADWASDDWQRHRAEAARAEQQRQAEFY